jgi:hypothetical protein
MAPIRYKLNVTKEGINLETGTDQINPATEIAQLLDIYQGGRVSLEIPGIISLARFSKRYRSRNFEVNLAENVQQKLDRVYWNSVKKKLCLHYFYFIRLFDRVQLFSINSDDVLKRNFRSKRTKIFFLFYFNTKNKVSLKGI